MSFRFFWDLGRSGHHSRPVRRIRGVRRPHTENPTVMSGT